MVKLTIDGRQVQAEEGAMLLDVARENNIYIPSLCANESVTPYGACRLCLVEVVKNGRERLVASCLYPVEEGLVVHTDSERISRSRKAVMQLLLARCPDSEVLQKLADKLGIEKTPYKPDDEERHKKCILCALCVRACEEVVGVSAISLVNRGVNREMAIPFYDNSDACIACGSCAYICPTKAITAEDIGGIRRITMPHNTTEYKLKKCKTCGRYFAPKKQLDYIIKKVGLPADAFDNCPDCRD